MNNEQKIEEMYQYIKDIRDNIIQLNETVQKEPHLPRVIERVMDDNKISNEGVAKLIVLNAYLHMKVKFEFLPSELDKRLDRLEKIVNKIN